MSITLSIPPEIVQEVREWAEANGTSLNQYVRDCLECRCCEYICSSKIPLVAKIKAGKSAIMEMNKK